MSPIGLPVEVNRLFGLMMFSFWMKSHQRFRTLFQLFRREKSIGPFIFPDSSAHLSKCGSLATDGVTLPFVDYRPPPSLLWPPTSTGNCMLVFSWIKSYSSKRSIFIY